MSLELVKGTDYVLDVRTGELLSVREASLDDLAGARHALAALYFQRNEAAALIDRELVARRDEAVRNGERLDARDWTISVDRGGGVRYDSNALRSDLLERWGRGELTITKQAIERAFVVRQYYLLLREWDTLCKIAPELRAIGDMHATPVPRKVKVERRQPRAIEATAEEVVA
jgi:hypothetical protein